MNSINDIDDTIDTVDTIDTIDSYQSPQRRSVVSVWSSFFAIWGRDGLGFSVTCDPVEFEVTTA